MDESQVSRLYFVTGNAGKLREIRAIIPDVEQLKLDNLDEIQSLDPKKVIEHKLTQASTQHSGELIVEDTNLELSCLNDLPGTFITWFEKTIGVDGLAALAMKYEDRSALARVTIGYRNPEGDTHYFTGELEGEIVAPRGTERWGWNPIFLPRGSDRTFAEMSLDEKNQISMRAIATRKLKAYLEAHA